MNYIHELLKNFVQFKIITNYLYITQIKISYGKVYSNTLFYDKVQFMELRKHSKVNKLR